MKGAGPSRAACTVQRHRPGTQIAPSVPIFAPKCAAAPVGIAVALPLGMTTLAASLAARFSSFAIVAALTLSTVLSTGCANGEALESSEEMDGTATAQVEQPGAATRQARKLGEAIPVPSGYVATAPSQLPGSFAKPELRKPPTSFMLS